MRYIEITIWNPLDASKAESFSWKPKFNWWMEKDGFDFDWLFISINSSLKKHDYNVPMPDKKDNE